MITPVYRVQCDGPGREWLAVPDDYALGTDLRHEALVVAPIADGPGPGPTEKAAKRAAVGAGWRPAQTATSRPGSALDARAQARRARTRSRPPRYPAETRTDAHRIHAKPAKGWG